MTFSQPIRKFAGPLFSVALTAMLAGCSSNDSPSNPGSAGSASGGSGNSGGSGTTTAGASNGAGSGNAIPNSDATVGSFTVQMKVDKSMTSIVGQVQDGPVPGNIIWTTTTKDGDCWLETPSTPFCEEGCGEDVCVGDNQCQPYPTGHSVGDVTLKGVHLDGGGTELTLEEIAKSYQPAAGTSLAFPSFSASDTISVTATGGDYAAFELSAPGVNALDLKTTDFALDPGKAFELAWDPAADSKASTVHVRIDVSHHGGKRGLIQCNTADTGALTVSKALISELIGLGAAGYPSVVITRLSTDYTQLSHGRVELEVSSLVERYLTTPGVDSCTTDEDCKDGKTCRSSDSTCQK